MRQRQVSSAKELMIAANVLIVSFTTESPPHITQSRNLLHYKHHQDRYSQQDVRNVSELSGIGRFGSVSSSISLQTGTASAHPFIRGGRASLRVGIWK